MSRESLDVLISLVETGVGMKWVGEKMREEEVATLAVDNSLKFALEGG